MRLKLLFLIGILVAVADIALASDADSVQTNNSVQRQEQRNEYYAVHSKIPSLLSGWSYSDFSYIGTGFSASGGNFHNPQLFGKHNFLELKTESILTLPEQKWRFYGEFGYRNGISHGGEWNLSYNQSKEGSPFYFMQEMKGKWTFQTYEFNAGAVKSLKNDKVFVGVGISYIGTLDFRIIDSRNENYKLDIGLTPSVTVKLTPTQSASLGLIFIRKKVEPQIYNKYQHGGDIEKYQVFFNEGLGSWDSNPALVNMTDNRYGGIASWGWKTPGHSATIIYDFAIGTEYWNINAFSNLATASSNFAKYNYLSNSLTVDYNKTLSKGALHTALAASYIIGEGSPYRSAVGRYEKNYNSSINQVNLSVSYLPLGSCIKRVGIGTTLESQNQKDLNYEHTIRYTNLTSNAWIDFIIGDVRKGSLLAGLNGGYHSNLNYLHTPKAAAGNFYNTKIALPGLAYLTSSYFIAGAKVGTEFDLSKNYRFELVLCGEVIKPSTIKYAESSATFSTSDSFYNVKINLLFNF